MTSHHTDTDTDTTRQEDHEREIETGPRKVHTHTQGVYAGGNIRVGMHDMTRWEDPATGQLYPTRAAAQRAIDVRLGRRAYRVEGTAVSDFVITNENTRRMVGTTRYATRREANEAVRQLLAAGE